MSGTEGAILCRLAGKSDTAAVGELFYRCDLHYWGDRAPSAEAMATHVRKRVMAEDAAVEIVLAEENGDALGFATFTIMYPAPDLGGQLYLKDLFVLDRARGKGVGLILMRYLAAMALERGCVRFDWTAEENNPRAMEFYAHIGAQQVTNKVYYRFDGAALRRFAEGD